MVLTKEHQEAMIDNYSKTHTIIEVMSFIDGMTEMRILIERNI
jgi:hypothetical protein